MESGIKMFFKPFEIDVESVSIYVQMEQCFLIVGSRLSGGINKFPGGMSPYALENMEILINKFTNEYICFYSLFKLSGASNKGQLLKGGVVEKRLTTTATEFIELQNDLDLNTKFLSKPHL